MTPDRTQPPQVRPFGKLTLPADTVETLANGLTLHSYSGGDQPVCRLSLYMQGGRAEFGDAAGRMATCQLAEGSTLHSAEEIAEAIDYNGATVNTRLHQHHASIDMAVLNHRAEAMLPVFAEIAASPAFDSERLDVAKAIAIDNLNTARMDTAVLADEALMPLVFGASHPLAKAATVADYHAVDAATLHSIHSRMLCPARMHAYLSGQLTPGIVASVRTALESLAPGGDGTQTAIVQPQPAAPGTTVDVAFARSLQSAVAIALPAPPRAHPDYIKLRLAVIALGGYFGSRLMTNIREDKGLTYGISAALLGSLDGSYVNIAAKCDKTTTATVIDEIANEMRRLASEPPRGDELERLRLFAASNLAELLDTPSRIMGYYATSLLVGTPDDYFNRQQAAIAALSSDTIAEMASAYLCPESALRAVAGAD